MGLIFKTKGDNGKSIAYQRQVFSLVPESAPATVTLQPDKISFATYKQR
jgi:hypothetical protein